MNRPPRPRPSALLLLMAVASMTTAGGCDYAGKPKTPPREIVDAPLPSSNIGKAAPQVTSARPGLPGRGGTDSAESKERREAILQNVMNLIETAAVTPGGNHFSIATKNLNQYFEQGTRPEDWAMNPASGRLLVAELPPEILKDYDARPFALRDARHIEDCMIYHEIATRIAGEGDELTRVRRVFDWMVRQVQLVPAQALAPNGRQQAQARPYDVLLRGMATEYQGYWTERGWLFMALLRQLGIDSGLVMYQPRPRPRMMAVQPANPAESQPVVWVTAVLVGDKAYLFDQRLGIAIPNARGDGVATLDEAMTDPTILARLDLPGESDYGTTRSDLVASPTKITILIDSSRGYFSPKMRLLQSRLTGRNRTILFRDYADQRDHFVKALGDRLGDVKLWLLPLQVETLLFSDGTFVAATQASLRLFKGELPLLYARVAQLKGDVKGAMEQYISFRLVKNGLMRDKKTPIVGSVQRELDVYATYFLALAHLEQGNLSLAKTFFEQILKTTPEPGPAREHCFMFRWGATTNLGLMAVARNDIPEATRYLSEFVPPTQFQGNLYLAREILWPDPMAGVAPPIPTGPVLPSNPALTPTPTPTRIEPGPGPAIPVPLPLP